MKYFLILLRILITISTFGIFLFLISMLLRLKGFLGVPVSSGDMAGLGAIFLTAYLIIADVIFVLVYFLVQFLLKRRQ